MTNILYQKRAARVRTKLKKINSERFRLTVFRSSRNISAQIIDDKNNKTLISASSFKEKNTNKKKTDLSLLVAEMLAKKAIEKKITKVYFDRGVISITAELKFLLKHYVKEG